MKFTCTQENLNHGLALVSRVASKNVALPILNNVLIIAENGLVKLQTTNLELGVTVAIRAKIDVTGRYTVQSRLLNDFVAFLDHEQVIVELTDAGLNITSGHSKTSIKGLSAEEFPVLPVVELAQTTTIPANQLLTALAGVTMAVANDESRPEISGVYIHLEGDIMTVAATDSYRLSERKITILSAVKQTQSIILPARTAQELSRLLPADDTVVTIQVGENQLHVSFDDLSIVSRVIEGQYPDYKQIIPQQWHTKVTIPKDEFINHLKSASLFCKSGINDVTLEIDPAAKALRFTAANSQLGEHRSDLSASVEGNQLEMVFNYRYLLDGLGALQGDEISLECTDANGPGLLHGAQAERELYLVMPIRQ